MYYFSRKEKILVHPMDNKIGLSFFHKATIESYFVQTLLPHAGYKAEDEISCILLRDPLPFLLHSSTYFSLPDALSYSLYWSQI